MESWAAGINNPPICSPHPKCWLELTDKQHRYAKNLRCYYREWERLDRPCAFWVWLDTAPLVSLQECPREKLQRERVAYLDCDAERLPYVVEVHSGHFYRPAHAGGERSLFSTSEGDWIFVMSPARVLFCNRKRKASFHHTSFLGGGPCLAAGQLIVQDGVLSELYLHSGHYRPTDQHLHHLLAHLRTLGVDLTTVSVDAQRTFKVARAEGNAAKKVTSMMRSAALVLAFLETKAAAARRGSVFDELRATAACRRPSSDNGAAAGVGADDGDDHLARLTRACQVSAGDAGDTAEGSFAAAPLEADASATERFMERALAAPGTTSVPRADAAPPGSSTGEPIDAVGAELTDSSSDDEAEGG